MRGLVPGLQNPHPLGPRLPALYQEDDLALRFVAAFDDALAPVLSTLDNLPAHVDPRTCPEDWVAWLAEWLGLADAGAPGQRRARLAGAAGVHAMTGTADGIRAALETALDVGVEVEDSGDTQWSPVPGGPLPGDPDPVLRIRVVRGAATAAEVRALCDDLAPAHVRVVIDAQGGSA